MRLLPPHLRRKPHHDSLGNDQPAADAEIFRHLLLIHHQPLKREFRLMKRTGAQHKALGNSHPLGLPRPGGAFQVLNHGVQHQAGVLTASISSEEIGLRFCGMVEDAPRPFTNGSYSSANSVDAMIMMSSAIFPSD